MRKKYIIGKSIAKSSLIIFCTVPLSIGVVTENNYFKQSEEYKAEKTAEISLQERIKQILGLQKKEEEDNISKIRLSSGEEPIEAESQYITSQEDLNVPTEELLEFFASKRLLVATDDETLIRPKDPVVSEYEGLYIIQYQSVDEAIEAYKYFFDKCDFVEPDVQITAAENELVSEEAIMTSKENPFTELEKSLEETPVNHDVNSHRGIVTIALLDTGSTEYRNTIESVSLISDDDVDRNGHARKMIDVMSTIYEDVKIHSIKVLDDEAKGTVSSIIAGIEYAIKTGADIINLSLTAPVTKENSLLNEYIKKAVQSGIIVVAAAGNEGRNTKYYVPSNCEEAIVVAALNNDGEFAEFSNRGESCDYGVKGVSSTSRATAIVSARIAQLLEHGQSIENLPDNKIIKLNNQILPDIDLPSPQQEDSYFSAAAPTLKALNKTTKLNGITITELPAKLFVTPDKMNWNDIVVEGPETYFPEHSRWEGGNIKTATIVDVVGGETIDLASQGYKITYNNAFKLGDNTYKIVVTPQSIYFNTRTMYYLNVDTFEQSTKFPAKRFVGFVKDQIGMKDVPVIEFNSTPLSYAAGIAPWERNTRYAAAYAPDVTVRIEIINQDTGRKENIKQLGFLISDIDMKNDGFTYSGNVRNIYVGSDYENGNVRGAYEDGTYYFRAKADDVPSTNTYISAVVLQSDEISNGDFQITSWTANKGWSHIELSGIVLVGTVAKVKYYDISEGKELLWEAGTLVGDSGEEILYDPQPTLDRLRQQGYIVVDNPFASAKQYFEDKEKTVEITLRRMATSARVIYRDITDNKVLEQQAFNGYANTVVPYDPAVRINHYQSQKYILVKNEWGSSQTFPESGEKIIYIDFEHKITNSTEHDSVNRTIDYRYSSSCIDSLKGKNAADSKVDNIDFSCEVELDETTGMRLQNWYPSSASFASVTSPVINGYTPDRAVVNGRPVSHDAADIHEVVLYSPNKYKIHFDANRPAGSNGSGTMADQENLSYDFDYNLSENKFTTEDWVWTSWNTKSDGTGTAYQNKQSFKNLTEQDGSTVTLFAQWKPVMKAKVVYRDVTDREPITLETSAVFSGDSGAQIPYSAAETITKYDNKGYSLVRNGLQESPNFPTAAVPKEVTLFVDLKRKREQLHDDDSLQETVTRTIRYVYSDGHLPLPADEVVQKRDFSRIGYKDSVTGEFIYEPWLPITETLQRVDSPSITGYKPDRGYIDAKTITATDEDILETVTYSPIPYTLTVNPNGGTWQGSKESSSITKYINQTQLVELPVREDYKFTGWTKTTNPFSGTFEPTTDAPATYAYGAGNDTITANWVRYMAKYRINFFYEVDGQYPSLPDKSEERKGIVGQQAIATTQDKTPQRDKYVLDDNAENILSAEIQPDDTTQLNIYFKRAYTVEYKPGPHATFDPEITPDIDYGEDTPPEPNKYCEVGYIFDSWSPQLEPTVTKDIVYTGTCKPGPAKYSVEYYYQENGQYGEYDSKVERTGITGQQAKVTQEDKVPQKEKYVIDEDAISKTYEALIKGDGSTALKVYFKKQYTIIYEPGDHGTFSPQTNKDLDYGVSTPEGPEITGEPGYDFVGWNKEVSPIVTKDEIYIAQWKGNDSTPYTVEHYLKKLNEETYELVEEDIEHKYGTTDTMAHADPNDYYGFVYNEEISSPDMLIKGDGSTVLKLYYDRLTYKVIYKPGEHGTFPEKVDENLEYGSPTPQQPEKTHEPGYEFNGWTPQVEPIVTKDRIYVATWIPADVQYKVEFYYEKEGTYTLEPDKSENRIAKTESLVKVTDEDKKSESLRHVLDTTKNDKWSDTVLGTGQTVLKLYFKEKFTVVYNPGKDGDFPITPHPDLEYGVDTPSEPNTDKKGYKFIGWDTKTGKIEPTVTKDITYTAIYEPVQYTVIYKPNGGKGTMDPQKISYDQTGTYQTNKFTRDSCTFKGWNEKEDGKGNTYKEGAEFKNLTDKDGAEIVLFAIWDCPVQKYVEPPTGI